MTQFPHVAIVVLHWRNIDDTAGCLKSLSKLDYSPLTIILVDNASPDFDEDILLNISAEVVIVKAPHNLGFSGGNNLGIHEALKQGADWVMLLNNDTVVTHNQCYASIL